VYDALVRKHIPRALGVALLVGVVVFLGAREPVDEIAVESATQATILVTEYPCELEVNDYIEGFRRGVRGLSLFADVPRVSTNQRLVFAEELGRTPLGKCIAVATDADSQWYGTPVRDGYLHRISSSSDGSLVVTATQEIGQRTRFDIGKVLPLMTVVALVLGGGYVFDIVLDFWSGNLAKEPRPKA
jgi:hypothetical protein